MGVQRPRTHYPNALERQAIRVQGYLRRCHACGLLMPLVGGKPTKRGWFCRECKPKTAKDEVNSEAI